MSRELSTMPPALTTTTAVAVDDRVQRRREQYKAYQRRRRARERLRLERLQLDVQALVRETHDLQTQNLHLFASRGTDVGAPATLVAEFYNVYARGYSATHSATQDEFLHAMMAPDVQGPDYCGVDALIEQWRLYGSLFVSSTYVPQHTTVVTIDETTLVVVDVVMTVRPNRQGVRCFFPRLADDEELVQRMLFQPTIALGSVRFLFDAHGKVTWFGADMDFVAALIGMAGSIPYAMDWLSHSNFSLSTGRISSERGIAPVPLPWRPSKRHSIAFLLS